MLYLADCQGLKKLLEDIEAATDREKMLLMLEILLLILPTVWPGFPPFNPTTDPPSNEDILAYVETLRADENGPCHEEIGT